MTRVIRRKLHWPTIGLTVLVSTTILLGTVVIITHVRQQVPLPAAIKRQIDFPIFLPAKYVDINTKSYKFDPTEKILSFTGTLADGQTVTFAEQATPSAFTDIPDFYNKFLQKLYEYQSFDSLNGTVHITHPKDAGQAAVMSSKGTLLFARVTRDEPQTTWQPIFNNLQVYAP